MSGGFERQFEATDIEMKSLAREGVLDGRMHARNDCNV